MNSNNIHKDSKMKNISRFFYYIKSKVRRMDRKRWFKYCSIARYKKQNLVYHFPAHPYKVIDVNPSNIERWTKNSSKKDGLGHINSEEWDTRQIDNMSAYNGLKQRFVKDYDWYDTDLINYVERKIEERGSMNGYNCIDQYVSERCKYIDTLYNSIKNDGYRPNYLNDVSFPEKDKRNKRYNQSLEPFVAIGPEGEIHWRDGFHRFTIASILNIKIPVYVLVRHSDWQKNRDEIYNAVRKPTQKEKRHPDLQDIVGSENKIWD